MIEIKNLSKTFSGTGDTVEALKNISITIADGDILWHYRYERCPGKAHLCDV